MLPKRMYASLLVVLSSFLMTTALVLASTDNKVKISVFYEALCPDSIDFIRNQLWPTYESLKNILDVDLVPYGKATHSKDSAGNWHFECQHGPHECKGNKVQGCAIKLYPKDSAIQFVKCVMSRRRPHESGEACASQLHLDVDSLNTCSSGTSGDDFLASLGDRTHALKPKMTFVPWINLNDKHDADQQWESLRNLKKVVCSAYNSTDRPSACP